MNANFPLGVILLDYILGAAMWTLIGRFGMSIFLPDQSSFSSCGCLSASRTR